MPMKSFPFPEQPYDYSLFIRGVKKSGEIDNRTLDKADDKEIANFEKTLGFELPTEYVDFLRNCNGGVIDPNRASRSLSIDTKAYLSGKPFPEPSVGTHFFFTLDKKSLSDGEDASTMVYLFHLPSAQNIFHDLEYEGLTKGLENEKLLYFINGHSYYFLLGCEGQFKNKVLVLNTNLEPNSPLENVAVVAESFDAFMQSLYYEAK